MGESLKSERMIREYLLGRVSDETTLTQIEELLFSDEEFCSQVAMVEDSLINDYVLGSFNAADIETFRATLAGNPDRAFKVELTQALREKAVARNLQTSAEKPTFFAALSAFFHQPKYVGAFAVVLLAMLAGIVYFSRNRGSNDLAELRSMYSQSRPNESRISQFDYAPLSQLRGQQDSKDQSRLRRIENNLLEATEKKPGAETFHALGVFNLTQQKFPDAIGNFEKALTFNDKIAKLHNDLGAAHFELAKTVKDKRFEELSRSLEEFTKATELDSNLLEALFNKALVQQQLRLPQQARESWLLYLQKDASSPWAEEARKNLTKLESGQVSKNDDQILEDFLNAYRNRDETRAQEIHNETKGLLRGSAVALQLSRKYLLSRQGGDKTAAKESLEALTWLGRYERERHGEFFFLS
ncbi:MAG TPA: hypothetical protein VN643_12235 [Pyrinomonadaceae bacterium]|nr:hypothetical protein [Pyrinomonadaceae bacterium]